MSKRPRNTCRFNRELQHEFPYLQKLADEAEVHCTICNSSFYITYGGRNDIQRHSLAKKHQKRLNSMSSSSSNSYTTHVTQGPQGIQGDHHHIAEVTKNEDKKPTRIPDIAIAYHIIKHNHYLQSLECNSKMFTSIAGTNSKYSLATIKSTIENLLLPFSLLQLEKSLAHINCCTLYSDTFTYKDLELFPFVIRTFDEEHGIQLKLLDLMILPSGYTDITEYIVHGLKSRNLMEKFIVFCSGDANSNFGGREMYGNTKTIDKMRAYLNQPVLELRCTSHVIQNALQIAIDVLPIDLDSIILKIHSYFYSYNVKVESLEDFCQNVEIDYQRLLTRKTDRLQSLLPIIGRVVKYFQPLKEYFILSPSCPSTIHTFFSDQSAEIWVLFLYNQISIVFHSLNKIQSHNRMLIEVVEEIDRLMTKYKDRILNRFIPPSVKRLIAKTYPNDNTKFEYFTEQFVNFYSNCLTYLQYATPFYDELMRLRWILLKNIEHTKWEEIEESLSFVKTYLKFPCDFSDDHLFDEIQAVKQFVTAEKLREWHDNQRTCAKKWIEVFTHFRNNDVPYKNIKLIVEFCLCLPSENAVRERVLPIVHNSLSWLNDKSQSNASILKAVLMTKLNFAQYSCHEFLHLVREHPESKLQKSVQEFDNCTKIELNVI